MAKDKTTRSLTGPRRIVNSSAAYSGTYTGIGFSSSNNWRGEDNAIFFHGKVNVNLSIDDLTIFPQNVMIQDPGTYSKSPSADVSPNPTGSDLLILDIISIKELDMAEVIANARDNNTVPGMIGSTDDWTQIVMGQWRLYSLNNQLDTQTNIQSLISMGDFSSAAAFAQDYLHFYRIAIPRTATPAGLIGMELSLPAARFVIDAVIGQEETMPYMMRLKNSYELQQS